MGERSRRVLVAEDHVEMRELIAHALRRDGHEVIAVGDGRALLAMLDAPVGFDVVVSDVRMPELSGLEVLAVVVARPTAHPPFVLFTAFADARVVEGAMRLGASAVLSKPFELDELRLAVRTALGAENV